MAKKSKSKKSKKSKMGKANVIPLAVLEKRQRKLRALVVARGGKV